MIWSELESGSSIDAENSDDCRSLDSRWWGDVDWSNNELVIRHQSWVDDPQISNIWRLFRDDEIQ